MQLKLSFSSAAKLIVEVENRFASARRSKYEYNNSSLYIFGMLSNLILITSHFFNTSSICQKIDTYQALRIHDSDINILHLLNTHKNRPPEFCAEKSTDVSIDAIIICYCKNYLGGINSAIILVHSVFNSSSDMILNTFS